MSISSSSKKNSSIVRSEKSRTYPRPMPKIESRNRISVDLKFATLLLALHSSVARIPSQLVVDRSPHVDRQECKLYSLHRFFPFRFTMSKFRAFYLRTYGVPVINYKRFSH